MTPMPINRRGNEHELAGKLLRSTFHQLCRGIFGVIIFIDIVQDITIHGTSMCTRMLNCSLRYYAVNVRALAM
jgi:hypothetical protein